MRLYFLIITVFKHVKNISIADSLHTSSKDEFLFCSKSDVASKIPRTCQRFVYRT